LEKLVVLPAQLGEVLAAERSAEVAHERYDERLLAPAFGQAHLSFP
jgi:hypothetical protein